MIPIDLMEKKTHGNINLLVSYLYRYLDKPYGCCLFNNRYFTIVHKKIIDYEMPSTIDHLINGDDVKIAIFSHEIDTRKEILGKKIGTKSIFDRKNYPVIIIIYDQKTKCYNAYIDISSNVDKIVYPLSLIYQKFENLKIVNCFFHQFGSFSEFSAHGWNLKNVIVMKREKKHYKWWHLICFGKYWDYGDFDPSISHYNKIKKLSKSIGSMLEVNLDEQDLDDDYVFLLNANEFFDYPFDNDDVDYYIDLLDQGMTDIKDIDDYL
jgi:hypothetical protein